MVSESKASIAIASALEDKNDVGGKENYAITFPELSKRKALKKKGGPFRDWKARKSLKQMIFCHEKTVMSDSHSSEQSDPQNSNFSHRLQVVELLRGSRVECPLLADTVV